MADISTPITRVPNQTLLVDQIDPNNIYIAYAKIGSATSSAVWQVRKLSNNASVWSFGYAGGSSDFDKIWDNRVSYIYS